MISNNGGTWSAAEKEMNNKVKAFKFDKGEKVICELDLNKKQITFTHDKTK